MTMTIEQLIYTGEDCTMVCMVDHEMFKKYRNHEEGIIPSQVVDSYDIFKFESGTQGILQRPSKAELSSMFGTNDKERAIKFMLENGEVPVHIGKKNKGGDTVGLDANPRFHVASSGRPL